MIVEERFSSRYRYLPPSSYVWRYTCTDTQYTMATRLVIIILGIFLAAQVLSQLTCPEKNGRFPTKQCDTYIQCEDGVPEEIVCPDGLLFNTKARYFAYPCQYPVDVDCEGRTGLQTPRATEDCPHQYGYFKVGDQNNCGQFMNCVGGRGYLFNCPEGLAFSQDTYRCDWPDQVPSCDAEAFLGFRCPEPLGEGFFTDDYRFYRHPDNCQKYFICINGRPRLYSCGEGYAFNEIIGGCDGVENVTGCGVPAGAAQRPGIGRRS